MIDKQFYMMLSGLCFPYLVYCCMSALLVTLGTWTMSDLHPAIALATTAHLFHFWEQCTSRGVF